MSVLDRLAKMLFIIACTLVVLVMLTGCSMVKEETQREREKTKAEEERAEKNKLEAANREKENDKRAQMAAAQTAANQKYASQAVRLMTKGNPIDVPAPELENINRYASALEENLLKRYNNTPRFAGNVAKVRLLAEKEPEFSMDRKKIRMEWAQVVFDHWGKRIPELEEEYYVVVFGDGKPLMQRTRPSISIGLNNESGYSEFSRVRGGALSKMEYDADPTMFDKPTSSSDSLLDDNLNSKDSNPMPYKQFDIDPLEPHNAPVRKKGENLPVIQPAEEELQALVVLTK